MQKCKEARAEYQAGLGYTEREQFGRSQNGDFNTEGLSSPWISCRSASLPYHYSPETTLPSK